MCEPPSELRLDLFRRLRPRHFGKYLGDLVGAQLQVVLWPHRDDETGHVDGARAHDAAVGTAREVASGSMGGARKQHEDDSSGRARDSPQIERGFVEIRTGLARLECVD